MINGSIIDDGAVFDPFIGSYTQTHRLKAYCRIIVDQTDVTNKLDPHLLSVHIIDGPHPECELDLDDRDGKLPIPPAGAPMHVELGWEGEDAIRVFDGAIQSTEHVFNRKEGGRRMLIMAMGHDMLNTNGKTQMQNHWGEGAPPGKEVGNMVGLPEVLQEAGKKAGLNVQVHPQFNAIKSDYWAQTNESFMHLITRMGRDYAAQHKISGGNNVIFTVPGFNVDGTPSNVVVAQWGDNIIAWRVRPMSAHGSWGQANQNYFDQAAAQWGTVAQKFNMPNPWSAGKGSYGLPAPAPNRGDADNRSSGVPASNEVGEGRIVINGEPRAQFPGRAEIRGARPGVDGMYTIVQVEHLYSRSGYITWLIVWPNTGAPAGQNVGEGYPPPYSKPGAPTPPNVGIELPPQPDTKPPGQQVIQGPGTVTIEDVIVDEPQQ